jgi:hypothetical protein
MEAAGAAVGVVVGMLFLTNLTNHQVLMAVIALVVLSIGAIACAPLFRPPPIDVLTATGAEFERRVARVNQFKTFLIVVWGFTFAALMITVAFWLKRRIS